MKIERREHVRYLPYKNAFAALGNNYSKVGNFKDISLGGLAFEYITGEVSEKMDTHADIFLLDSINHLYNIPCQVVYAIEIYVPNVNRKLAKVLSTRLLE